MWWLLWVAVLGVFATALLIAYLVDRRGPNGMTDRDRGQLNRSMPRISAARMAAANT